ncbi:hypothetical protein Pst134EA_017202 [Puccinia striiformis f. sp. tritici]|uniref:hypothetical protein n=1 Tax=Puccinia striiformis f. sp. tritici TaxID=168172 RepID=UPI000A128E29|nr:hypothetical protein Pst134EA_017202 [Puccinia striiformis f. sp. tritici]KAH9460889.1 hypothetical protein Pst134EA_017202 [Puccinia striiformis f. sp. tritici]
MSDLGSELSDNPHLTDTPETQQLRQQADLVIQGFDSLVGHEFDLPNTAADLSIDRLRSKDGLITKLHSDLLPLLHEKVTSLSEAMNPSELRTDTANKFALILEFQQQISQTLDQTIRTAQDIIPGRVPKPFNTSDHHFEEFKLFRFHGLDVLIRESLNNHLRALCRGYRHVIEKLMCPAARYLYYYDHHFEALEWSLYCTTTLLGDSELNIIRVHWLKGTWDIVNGLEEVSIMADPRSIHGISISEGGTQDKALIQLSKPFIPIVKLSRLFFVKLSREIMNIDQAASFTRMSSDEFDKLRYSAEEIGECVKNLAFHLSEAHTDERAYTSRILIIRIEELAPYFQSYMALVILYIVPSYRDIYFRDWFVSWNTSFSVASYNAIQSVHFFEQDEP